MNEQQNEMLRKCFEKWRDNQWDGDDCMSRLADVFVEELRKPYEVTISFRIRCDAIDERSAANTADYWLGRVQENPNVDLPEFVHSVQTLGQIEVQPVIRLEAK
jgi:hypothetical protein